MREFDVTKELKDLFIDDETVDTYKKFIQTKLLSKVDWRQGFRHFDIYNRLNHESGLLKKLEACRRDISCQSAEQIIEILYILGYSHKRIIFILWEWGYDLINRKVVCNFLTRKKVYLQRKRIEFMELILQVKDGVFQGLKEEILAAEKKSVQIYLNAISKWQEEMETLDPVKDTKRFGELARWVEKYQTIIKDAHGINDVRKKMVEINGDAALAEKVAKIKKELETPTPTGLEEGRGRIIESDSNVLG